MELIKILGIDPSLRNTGLAILEYNNDLSPVDPDAFQVTHCQVLSNPQKYTGTDAIMNMLDMMHEQSQKPCYREVETVIIESPSIMFNKTWSGGTLSSIAHVSGGAIAIFGIHKSYIFRPNEWNKTRKKEVTHNNTIAFLGEAEEWHYEKKLKSDRLLEHILDATSMALWWIRSNYLED